MRSELTRRDEAEHLYDRIADLVRRPTALMEVCGTHTMAIGRFGLRARMPEGLRLIPGPGCPVCVTPCEQIDQVIAMVQEPGVTVASFGDMLKVPGSESSLACERAAGRDVNVVYSPMDALLLARAKPHRKVVFFGVGFETTSPTIAATLVRAAEMSVRNFFVFPAFKLVPPAMAALIGSNESGIDGFICPGHVSAITGKLPYEPLAAEHRVPCVITGFEALDILEGVTMLLDQIIQGRAEVEVEYRRAVSPEGNPTALALLSRVFQRCRARWRGIGTIPDSGLQLSEEYAVFDARRHIPVQVSPVPDFPDGCACGEVIRGLLIPNECRLFGTTCAPAHPMGPCMISSEGACAAYFRYGA